MQSTQKTSSQQKLPSCSEIINAICDYNQRVMWREDLIKTLIPMILLLFVVAIFSGCTTQQPVAVQAPANHLPPGCAQPIPLLATMDTKPTAENEIGEIIKALIADRKAIATRYNTCQKIAKDLLKR